MYYYINNESFQKINKIHNEYVNSLIKLSRNNITNFIDFNNNRLKFLNKRNYSIEQLIKKIQNNYSESKNI